MLFLALSLFSSTLVHAQTSSYPQTANIKLIKKSWKDAEPAKAETLANLKGDWIQILKVDWTGQARNGNKRKMKISTDPIVVAATSREEEVTSQFTGKTRTKTITTPEIIYPGQVQIEQDSNLKKANYIFKGKSLHFTMNEIFETDYDCRYLLSDQRVYCRTKEITSDAGYEIYSRTYTDKIEPPVPVKVSPPIPAPDHRYPQIIQDTRTD